jgi:hypothetical protein
MTPVNFSKFKKFIYFPDFANKFLLSDQNNILPLKNYNIYFKYIFTNQDTYNPLAIKKFLMMESIYPKRCSSSSNIIKLKFTKNRCHSIIFMKLNLDEFVPFYSFYVKRPVNITTATNSLLKQTKYFIFPGFISQLWFPSWERNVVLDLKAAYKTNSYSFLMHKTAFFD